MISNWYGALNWAGLFKTLTSRSVTTDMIAVKCGCCSLQEDGGEVVVYLWYVCVSKCGFICVGVCSMKCCLLVVLLTKPEVLAQP